MAKLGVSIDLADMVKYLREAVQARYPEDEIGEIVVTSYEKPMIHVDEYNMVTCNEFRHRAKEG